MGTQIVVNAQDVVLSLHGPGTSPGADEDSIIPEGKAGLVIRSNGDTVVVIGTPQQLRERVAEGLSLPIPDGVPLFDGEDA